ncbi:MAG: LTA synthase family protein [Bacteroidales bacterium]
MRKLLVVFLKYYLFWLLYFTAFKIVFLIYNLQLAHALPFSDLWGIFRHGIIMDLSVAGYFSLLPGVAMSLGFLFTSRFCSYFLKYYTLLMLILLTFLGLSDMGLYPAWGSRLNAQFLMYLETPGGIYASLSWWQLLLFPTLWIGIVWLSMWTYGRLLPIKELFQIKAKWYGSLTVLILSGALIIPIRGGLDRSPLNHSSVYFSKHLVANQFAYNYFWNFIHSVLKSKDGDIKLNYMDHKEAESILKEHYKTDLQAPQIIDTLAGKPTNIILVMLESFSNKIIEPLGGMPAITPRLNGFCHEGIAFKNFYSTGNRSDKGMSALIGGHPSDMNPNTALVFPDKMSKLDYFPKYFANRAYNMSFYYGGDVNFYNTRAVMLQSGIEKIVSKSDFPLDIGLKQKWGVPDKYLYARLFEDLKQEKEPFFSMVYNISSHEPFDIADYSKIKGNSSEKKYLNVASYSDSCLGVFIDSLKQTPFWDNTLVIITADHTSIEPGPSNITEPATYRIPLIFIGGVVKQHFISERFGNQNDLAPMLLKQLGWQHKPTLLSKDFLVDDSYAFYFRSEGWGFISPDMGWFMNMNTGKRDFFYNNTPAKTDSLMNFAKAYVQYLHDTPLDKM